MRQSAVLKAGYEAVYSGLSAFGGETRLFVVDEFGAQSTPDSSKQTVASLGVCDVSQICQDKNGHTVESEGQIYEAPTQVGYIISVTVASKSYPALLEAAGAIVQYFKDNNAIRLADYSWHGEAEGKIVIEPVIHAPDSHKEPQFYNGLPSIVLKYSMDVGINSLNGSTFKRVKEREIKGSIIGT